MCDISDAVKCGRLSGGGGHAQKSGPSAVTQRTPCGEFADQVAVVGRQLLSNFDFTADIDSICALRQRIPCCNTVCRAETDPGSVVAAAADRRRGDGGDRRPAVGHDVRRRPSDHRSCGGTDHRHVGRCRSGVHDAPPSPALRRCVELPGSVAAPCGGGCGRRRAGACGPGRARWRIAALQPRCLRARTCRLLAAPDTRLGAALCGLRQQRRSRSEPATRGRLPDRRNGDGADAVGRASFGEPVATTVGGVECRGRAAPGDDDPCRGVAVEPTAGLLARRGRIAVTTVGTPGCRGGRPNRRQLLSWGRRVSGPCRRQRAN